MPGSDWLPELKLLLHIDPAKVGSDALLSWILDSLARAANRRLGADLIDPGADVTEDHDGENQAKIWVRRPPILAVTSLFDDPDRAFGAGTLIDPTDYIVGNEEGVVELAYFRVFGAVFNVGRKNVRVVYRPGLAEDHVDLLDMQLAVCKWAAREFRDSESKLQHVRATATAGGNVTYFERKMPDDVKEILDRHTFIPIGRGGPPA